MLGKLRAAAAVAARRHGGAAPDRLSMMQPGALHVKPRRMGNLQLPCDARAAPMVASHCICSQGRLRWRQLLQPALHRQPLQEVQFSAPATWRPCTRAHAQDLAAAAARSPAMWLPIKRTGAAAILLIMGPRAPVRPLDT